MSENISDAIIFDDADLDHFASIIQKEISEFDKQIKDLTARREERRARLSKINTYRFGIRNSSGSVENDLRDTVIIIFREAREPLAKREIGERYEKIKHVPIDPDTLFEFLKENQGELFEVVGERGGAKWILTENGDDIQET